MCQNKQFLPYRLVKSTPKSYLISIHYWISKSINSTLNAGFETKTLTFWVPIYATNLGKVQFSYVQKEIDRLKLVDKNINYLELNRNIGQCHPRTLK